MNTIRCMMLSAVAMVAPVSVLAADSSFVKAAITDLDVVLRHLQTGETVVVNDDSVGFVYNFTHTFHGSEFFEFIDTSGQGVYVTGPNPYGRLPGPREGGIARVDADRLVSAEAYLSAGNYGEVMSSAQQWYGAVSFTFSVPPQWELTVVASYTMSGELIEHPLTPSPSLPVPELRAGALVFYSCDGLCGPGGLGDSMELQTRQVGSHERQGQVSLSFQNTADTPNNGFLIWTSYARLNSLLPVPEAGTGALMLSGLGLLGATAAWRRRLKTPAA